MEKRAGEVSYAMLLASVQPVMMLTNFFRMATIIRRHGDSRWTFGERNSIYKCRAEALTCNKPERQGRSHDEDANLPSVTDEIIEICPR